MHTHDVWMKKQWSVNVRSISSDMWLTRWPRPRAWTEPNGVTRERSDAMLIIWHVLFKSTQVNIWYMLVYGCRETYRVMFNEVRGYCSFCWCWWKCFFFHKSQKLYIIDKAVASRKVISFYGPRRLSLQTRKASFSIFYAYIFNKWVISWMEIDSIQLYAVV